MIKLYTRYLVKMPPSAGTDSDVLDALVAEITPSGDFLRIVWEASPDGIAFPVRQEWVLRATFEQAVIEELPEAPSQINRAATTSGLPRSMAYAAEARGAPSNVISPGYRNAQGPG